MTALQPELERFFQRQTSPSLDTAIERAQELARKMNAWIFIVKTDSGIYAWGTAEDQSPYCYTGPETLIDVGNLTPNGEEVEIYRDGDPRRHTYSAEVRNERS